MSDWFKSFRSFNPNFKDLNIQLVSKQFNNNNNQLPSNTPILNE